MASGCRSISRPALNFLKSAMNKPSSKPIPSTRSRFLSPTFPRSPSEMGCVQSLLPFHSVVSSARLTSCLGMDLSSSRSLSQGQGEGNITTRCKRGGSKLRPTSQPLLHQAKGHHPTKQKIQLHRVKLSAGSSENQTQESIKRFLQLLFHGHMPS